MTLAGRQGEILCANVVRRGLPAGRFATAMLR